MIDGRSPTVLVFARAPVAGRTKTRLIPALGEHGAAALHTAMVWRTARTARASTSGRVVILGAPDAEHPLFRALERTLGVERAAQPRGDLGWRMARALERALARRPVPAVLVGTDCPDLTVADIRAAGAWLSAGGDAALGPALDGGYYLVGLRRPNRSIFTRMPWGSGRVLEETRRRLRRGGRRWCETAPHRDIDRPADLVDEVVEALLREETQALAL